jgi:nitrate/TMAO reductase-like tetraheme cytochrome c subunit
MQKLEQMTLIAVLALIFQFLFIPFSLADVMLEPKYVSPEMVEKDTLKSIYTRTFSGLLNVGVGTQMLLKGSSDTILTNPTWTVIIKPEGSAATFGSPIDKNELIQLITFIPDVIGTYAVVFADGNNTAKVTINAAKYIGSKTCAMCHKAKAAEWAETGHALHFTKALNGGSRSGTKCISCHTTGVDAEAVNGGFDDFHFVYPDTPGPGVADSLTAIYPVAMALANIQCEACHGPGSSHNGNIADSKMVASLGIGVCAQCHDYRHHVDVPKLKVAAHYDPPYKKSWNATCARCHTPEGYIEFSENKSIRSHTTKPFTCAVCHNPHSNKNEKQLRTVRAILANGEEVTDAGLGAICMNCHQSRQDANSYAETPSLKFGHHYGVQADVLIGTNTITFGKQLPTSSHFATTKSKNACVDCHKSSKGPRRDPNGDVTTFGRHTFAMVNKQGIDNVYACLSCHNDMGDAFSDKKYYENGSADQDGDGVEEGLQKEVQGLLDILGNLLPNANPHAEVDSTWTKIELKAAYNHRLVYFDKSYGIHNPAFVVALLKVSIQELLNELSDNKAKQMHLH